MLLCCGNSIAEDDPRVGQFNGSFGECEGGPGRATLDIWKQGYAYFDTDLNNYVQSGSQPGTISAGGRTIAFGYDRNSLGDVTHYSVDATLSADGQIVEGHVGVSGHFKTEGQQARTCQFSGRRVYFDPLYVDTVPGDFSCTGAQGDLPLFGTTGNFNFETRPAGPVPSCFAGPTLAERLRPLRTGRYAFEVYQAGSGHDARRPLAVFSSCDGTELACDAGGYLTVDLNQYEDVVMVVTEPATTYDVAIYLD